MSYLVCHMEKYKREQIKPINDHNNRVGDKHSNLDIDPELKHENFSALSGIENNPQVDYSQRVKEIIDAQCEEGYEPRKNAVMMVGIVVTSDHAFFTAMSRSEIKRFFKCAATFLSERYGIENVIDDKVHMDETTPHMHYEFAPVVEGRFCAKKLFNKVLLQQLQTDFAAYMKENRFDLVRGIEASSLKHIPIPELKRETMRAIHDYEVQAEILKSLSDDVADLAVDMQRCGLMEKHSRVIEDVQIFTDAHRKMIYEAAYNMRKKRELEDAVQRLVAEKNKLAELLDRAKNLLKGFGYYGKI